MLNDAVDGIWRSIAQSKAKGMVKIYQNWFQKFCCFCAVHEVYLEEVTSAEVLLFVQDLIERGHAPSTIGQAISGIAWHFQIADQGDPTKHRLISDLVSAAKRVGPAVQHKEPATHDHLLQLQQFAREK